MRIEKKKRMDHVVYVGGWLMLVALAALFAGTAMASEAPGGVIKPAHNDITNAASLQRGARVIVSGRLRQRSYETKEGEKRTVYELEVDEIGPSLRYATAKVQKMSRSGGGGGFGSGGGQGGGFASDDPWATAAPVGASSGGSGGGGNFDDEPPF